MNDTFDQALNLWPTPPTNPLEALRHTLDMYPDAPEGDLAIIATSNIYPAENGQLIRTGLTWGDLRIIAAFIKEQQS